LTSPSLPPVTRVSPVDETARPFTRSSDGRRSVAWLLRIPARTLVVAVKHHERDKRGVALERSLEADLDRFAVWLAADHTSLSGQAERNEARYAWATLARSAIALSRRLE
jgi:hypothetical protein